jgi:paired amphipathic helix protein Sin3a
VLNDEWVSHPTWASEESGFVSHKKTPFEEAVHKSEEERHEFHVQIEALVRTIAVLEPINSRIDEMTNEERSTFRLKPDFGGSGMAIYHRIIKKIYGRDMGLEVIQALQDCPSVAVPVVLNRLKQKDEEWRRAQREWSRTWKEVDSKNFYKSLDHQGTNFKQNDKKNITAKYFVADIQAIKKQQLKKIDKKSKPFAHASVGHQLEYSFKNTAVLQDTLKMVSSFLEHSQAQYSPQERRAVEKFLRAFVPMLCASSEAEFRASVSGEGAAGGEDDGTSAHDHGDGTPRSASGKRSASGGTHPGASGGIPANDLRKKLLKTAQEKASKRDGPGGAASGMESRAASPMSGHRSPRVLRQEEDSLEARDIWIKEAGAKSDTEAIASISDKDRPFFANTTFYTLLRLLEVSYFGVVFCRLPVCCAVDLTDWCSFYVCVVSCSILGC